jgi:hypothetical protein
MTMRTLALAMALTLGIGSAAMAQTVIEPDDPYVYREGPMVAPDVYDPDDEDNTGVSDRIEDDVYENENGITNGN